MNSEIMADIKQASGHRHITELHTDSAGVKHLVSYMAPAGFDEQAAMAVRSVLLGQQLIANDANNSIERLLKGENPLDMKFDYCTSKQAAGKMIRSGMESKKPYILLLLKPLIEHLKMTYTSAQNADYLGVTKTVLSKIWSRYDVILGQESFLTTDSGLAEEVKNV